jgi:hypothetical protein
MDDWRREEIIRNEYVRDNIDVAPMRENRLR